MTAQKMNPPILGHELLVDGAAKPLTDPKTGGFTGEFAGGCRCGARPEGWPNVSAYTMKRWHREHKAELLTAQKVDWHPPVVLEPRSVDVPTAAAALGINADAVFDEVHAGNLRHIRHGRRVLIPVPALDEWVASKERAS